MAYCDLPGQTILMHNPLGIRVEFNVQDQGLLELWISPQAGRSLANDDRNFSNRDDHTRLFDRILFPGLREADLLGCDWDAFHSVVRFRKQTLHILSVLERPAVIVWAEAPQVVDLKSDKADRLVSRDDAHLCVAHDDRAREFHYAAAISDGPGVVWQQVVPVVPGRSIYARANLQPGQHLVVAGELATEAVADEARSLATEALDAIVTRNERGIEAALKPGRLRLTDPALEAFIEKNRRCLLAMQDLSGAIRASLARIYYMVWVRDGAMTCGMQGASGWMEPLLHWARYCLANPTLVDDVACPGRAFLQLAGPITKREEDGAFFAVLSAFLAWTQSGDDFFRTGESLLVLSDAVDWLERWCFDQKRGMFGRFFACESSFVGSWDFGYDNAVGWVWRRDDDKSGAKFAGQYVRRAYDLYINLIMASVYRMLGAMDPEEGDAWVVKGDALVEKCRPFFHASDDHPDYGDAVLDDGSVVRTPAYSLDQEDYLWGQVVPPFGLADKDLLRGRQAVLQDALERRRPNYFLASYYSVLASADTLHTPAAEIYDAIRRSVEMSYLAGGNYPMPGAMLEQLRTEETNVWHYVRPQAFSTGPCLAALANLGVRRLPFGFALRPAAGLTAIESYQWGATTSDIRFSGAGSHCRVAINGQELRHTLQAPLALLEPRNEIVVTACADAPAGPCLVASSLALRRVVVGPAEVVYEGEAHGIVELALTGADASHVRIEDAAGQPVAATFDTWQGRLLVNARARGPVRVVVGPLSRV